MSPVAITPTCSPITRNCVVLVNSSTQRSVLPPALVIAMGETPWSYLAAISGP
jgi:hypothetical protein